MGAVKHDGLAVPGRVVLAHELRFCIGDLSVDPPTRQIQRGERRETLEPRVMQVLVALSQAGGIVTRDELVERCWDGRVVGDDAINRVISRLRHIGHEFGGCFSIETITKVGYRIEANRQNATRQADAPPPGSRGLDRRLVIGGGVALASLSVGAAVFRWPPPKVGAQPSPRAKALYDQAVIVRQEDNRQALAYLREAVRISPQFGEAWGALAVSYRIAIENEAPERVAGFEQRLREAARNAERYDPGNGDAAAALLPTGSPFGRWTDLEPVFRTAIRRRPDHGAAYALLGTLLMDVGRWSEAVPTLEMAGARNSSSPVIRYKLIISLWSAGQISAAEDKLDEAMQLWPQHGAIWQTRIKLLALTGRPREAMAFARDPAAQPLDEEDAPDMRGRLDYLTALATRSPLDVDRAMASALHKARSVELERLNIALQASALGRVETALDILEGIFLGAGEWALGTADKGGLATHPLFQPHGQPLWSEPRFNRILQQIGLEHYWRSTGTIPDYRRR